MSEKIKTAATDVIDKTIGSFGKYQGVILLLILLARLPPDWQSYNIVFILPKLNYVCMDDNAKNLTNHCPCENPQYDDSNIESSVISEWNLICERKSYASLAQSIIQLGILSGSIVCGYLSDRFGRKLMCCLTFVLTSVFVSLSAFSPYLWMFLALRFLSGVAVGGALTCSYIYTMELTGTTFRTYASAAIKILNVFSYFTIALVSYFLRRWRYIQLITAVPWILTVAFFWILPESQRWLITVGRKKEAIKILKNIAKRNGLPTENIVAAVDEAEEMSKTKDVQEKRGSIKDLFRTPKMRQYSICVGLLWLIFGHTKYSVNQYIGSLQGNLYINTVLSALSLTPAIFIFILITKYLKRRVGMLISYLLTSSSLLVFIFTRDTEHYVNLAFIILGHLGSYLAYGQIYLYSSEIFPTIVRNSAFGLVMTMGRLGSFLAPYDVNIGIEWVTFLILIVLPLLGSVILYFVPETKDMDLQNTMKQVEESMHTNTKKQKKVDISH